MGAKNRFCLILQISRFVLCRVFQCEDFMYIYDSVLETGFPIVEKCISHEHMNITLDLIAFLSI